ncbi:MAG: dihydroneopterin aldolase [Marinirhabdus sp.]|nr:dihydroneopterin aldolase [Marinirhabdus sp.]
MSTIRLKNIRIFTNHGCLIEEEKIGSDYLVNVMVKADLSVAAASDQLKDTVDYVHLQHIVKTEMSKRSKLLEQVGQRIIDAIFSEIALVHYAEVSISKLNPPIGGDVAEVEVTMTGTRASDE